MNLEPNELMTLVKGFMSKIDEQNKKIENLEKSIYEDFLGPAEQNFRDWDHSTRLGEFKEKYKDTFTEDLCNRCKKVEGDEDFDLPAKIFDDYESQKESSEDKSVGEEEYVALVVANLKEQLDTLKETLNADNVEVTQDATGETEVVADGDKVAEATAIATEVSNEVDNESDSQGDNEVDNEGDNQESDNQEDSEGHEDSDSHDKELEEFIKELEETEVDHKNYY